MECIVLAGGFGTRLQHILPDLPKCLAPINEKPFLDYLLRYLEQQRCEDVILSLGYKHEQVLDWIKTKAFTFKLSWVIEDEPLGTGGGIKRALTKCKSNQCFVVNGDTLFDVDLQRMASCLNENTKAVLALKPLENFDRYGTVQMDENGYITAFKEKMPCAEGLINGGVYLLNHTKIIFENLPDIFSIEKDFLEPEAQIRSLKGYVSNRYFIDIGVAEDYKKAQEEIR